MADTKDRWVIIRTDGTAENFGPGTGWFAVLRCVYAACFNALPGEPLPHALLLNGKPVIEKDLANIGIAFGDAMKMARLAAERDVESKFPCPRSYAEVTRNA